jgi:dipeptidase
MRFADYCALYSVTTHNADCAECDYRITHVPARTWPAGSKRPVYPVRQAYPRYIQDGVVDPNNLGPDYLASATYPEKSIYPWNTSKPMIFIDQVESTYAYTLGSYGIQNEKQLSIGESTCGAVFVATPINEGGSAAMDMQELTQIAMERCETARCAIKVMGDLAVAYGFFGPEGIPDTAGEALVIADTRETW